jgi:hypothetical protein
LAFAPRRSSYDKGVDTEPLPYLSRRSGPKDTHQFRIDGIEK